MAELEKLKSLLEQSKGEKGQNLQEHLTKVFSQLIFDYPRDPLSSLELTSLQVKSNFFSYQPTPAQSSLKESFAQVAPLVKQAQDLIKKPMEENEEGKLVEAVPEPLPHIPDLLQERRMLSAAGIDLGEEETFRLQQALKSLVRDKGAKEVRLWGKIIGTQKDYYVVEGVGEPNEDEDRPNDFEKRGEGVNAYTYWVTNSVYQEFQELPDVNPDQLKAARTVRKLFTGDLEAEVVTNPHFPGKEKDLLRAQIARITHGTSIIPKGLYRVQEDSPQEVEAEEEAVTPSTKELSSLDGWVHFQPGILKAGRIVHMEPEPPEEEDIDIDELKAKIVEEDPFDPRLKTITEDKGLPSVGRAWVGKAVGDPQEYEEYPPKENHTTFAKTVIRSLWWPGAVTVQQSRDWVSFYIGDGLKAATGKFYPVSPPPVSEEPQDPQEQSDPYPENPPEETPPEE